MSSAGSVGITLTQACLQAEFERLNIYPLNMITVGNHQVFISPEIAKEEKVQREFCAMVWLFKNRTKDRMQTCLNFKSVRKFFALKYGMSLFELYKNPEHVKKSQEAQRIHAQVSEHITEYNAEQVTQMLRKTPNAVVQIVTDEFGIVCLPSEQDMQVFLSRSHVVNGGFTHTIRAKLQNSLLDEECSKELAPIDQHEKTMNFLSSLSDYD